MRFVIALIAAVLGFGGIAAGATPNAKILFFVFIVIATITFRREPSEEALTMQPNNDQMKGASPFPETTAGDAGGGLLAGPTSESERFLADLKTFVSDADVLLGQARTLSGAGALAAREEFERRLAQARRGYEAARDVAVDHAHDYMDRTETYVRNEPWKAIGIAAVAGAIVGVVLSRR